ncbi:DUF2732 family protein [Pantoea eucalypti]|uniref:DUF2732 family protein n=1 Tax=Pantoea eucalypti TaxID=470933 RepID=UPI003D7D6DEA
MRNIQNRSFKADDDALNALLSKAKSEQRSDDALAASIHIAALAIHARKKEMSATEIIKLLERESERYKNQSQELH